jgi:streptothricin acetyltransferase
MLIRPLVPADLPLLKTIDANFTSDRFLDVRKSGDGFNLTWQLIERPLDPPFVSTDYHLADYELDEIAERLRRGDGLYLVIEAEARLIGLLDMECQAWRKAAMLWNLAIDRSFRGRGLGTELIRRALEWARAQQLRAIVLETQTNNYPACQFYRKQGFLLGGIDDHFYSNEDVALKEVAIFWWKEVTDTNYN